MKKILKATATLALLSSSTYALPIDWHGVFGVDTTSIDNYRRLDKTTAGSAADLSQELGFAAGNETSASFQSYVFRLNPHLIVNDSASFKAEFSSGYGRGGLLGEDSASNGNTTRSNDHSLYFYNTSGGSQNLQINKMYMELYSDTATYVIGRHSADWGLGVVQNSGKNVWDRHSFSRDGVTMKVKLGNFKVEPFWAKIENTESLTSSTKVSEMGLSLAYDNVDRDLGFGILYSTKEASSNNSTSVGTSSNKLGATDAKLTDIYFRKGFGKFNFAVEFPLLSGTVGDVYGTGSVKLKASALIFESTYELTDTWTVGIDAGQVSGDDGSPASFQAMYLNPNYQVANLLFRYNLAAVSNPAQSVHDSNISNASYLKLKAKYNSENWTWRTAMIYAKADQVATAGERGYNHSTNKLSTASATANQESDYGMELDLGFEYKWNEAVTVGGDFGYLFTGDYYGFNDTTTPNAVDNSYMMQLKTAIHF